MRLIIPILLGTAHALNDFLSGYILATYANTFSTEASASMLLIYGGLAFGGQIPVGVWLDKQPMFKTATIVAFIFLLFGTALIYYDLPLVTIVVIGIASALIHVAGGAWVLKIAPHESGITGIFVAPGVAGLTLGGFLGSQGIKDIPIYIFFAVLLLFAALLMASRKDLTETHLQKSHTTSSFETHDAVMLLILAAICLRSLLWDIINLFYGNNYAMLLAIGLSAFLGKIIGGFLSDALGWKRWLKIALPLSAILLAFLGENAVALCIGAALLQSTTPMMVRLMYSVFPNQPAIAVALSLGLGILLAGIPGYMPLFTEHMSIVLLTICAALPIYGWWLVRRLQ